MAFVMPEIVVRKVIDYGIKELRLDKAAFDDLFCQFLQDELGTDYGADYREKIWEWFSTTKIPVVQAWSFNAQRIPSISIHLANETEDESKAAFNDMAGQFNQDYELGTGVFTVMIDVGIHANKGGDHVLWLYYIVSYILFKHKTMAFRLGLKLGTFSASDYSKDAERMGNNVWTRWVRFRCTTQNFWGADPTIQIDEINIDQTINNAPDGPIQAQLDAAAANAAAAATNAANLAANAAANLAALQAAGASAAALAIANAALVAANAANLAALQVATVTQNVANAAAANTAATIAVEPGVDVSTIDTSANPGLRVSRIGDDEDIEDLNI